MVVDFDEEDIPDEVRYSLSRVITVAMFVCNTGNAAATSGEINRTQAINLTIHGEYREIRQSALAAIALRNMIQGAQGS